MTQEEREGQDTGNEQINTGEEQKGEHRGDKADEDTTEEARQRQYLEETGGE